MIDVEVLQKIEDLLFEFQEIAKGRGLTPHEFRLLLQASLALLARIRSEAYDIPYDKVIDQEVSAFEGVVRTAGDLPRETINKFLPPKYRK